MTLIFLSLEIVLMEECQVTRQSTVTNMSSQIESLNVLMINNTEETLGPKVHSAIAKHLERYSAVSGTKRVAEWQFLDYLDILAPSTPTTTASVAASTSTNTVTPGASADANASFAVVANPHEEILQVCRLLKLQKN